MHKTQAFLLIGALALAGCANNPYASNATTADTGGGALLGALAGAVIGNQTGAPLGPGPPSARAWVDWPAMR